MKLGKIRWGLTLVCFSLVLLLGIVAVVSPDKTKFVMDSLFHFTIFKMGSGFLWYVLLGTIFIIWICTSKYGNIYLGGNKPQFSKFQLFAMALSAGMGASTMYWGFIECIYYFMDPQFGITDRDMAMEYATAFNLFHWGPAGWVAYLMCAIPFIFVFYLKKNRDMSLSGVVNVLFDNKLPLWCRKGLDLLFIITSLAATALTLGLSIPMISSVVSKLTGVPNTLTLGIGIIIGLSIIFSLSSYIGIEKGMAVLSNMTVYICAAMVGIIFIIGPSALILNNITNATGIVFQDYIRMSLNTDPYGTTGFPQYWTIFFFANWISYAPGMGVFVTKIVKGHKLKDVLLLLIGAGSLGTFLIFGVCGTFTMNLMNTGKIDAVGLIANNQPDKLLLSTLESTPFPTVMIIVYLVTMVLFTVTTLDGTSFALASITSEKVEEDGNVSPFFRLFWCLLLAFIPIIFLIIKANLNILKAFPVLIIVPMMPIFLISVFKTGKLLKQQFEHMSPVEIENSTK